MPNQKSDQPSHEGFFWAKPDIRCTDETKDQADEEIINSGQPNEAEECGNDKEQGKKRTYG